MKHVKFSRIYFYLVININSHNVDDFSSEKLRKRHPVSITLK